GELAERLDAGGRLRAQQRRARPVRARGVAAWAAAAMLVASVVMAVVAARHAHPAKVSPVVPRGSWNAVWIAALVVALLAYGLSLLVVRGGLATARVLPSSPSLH